MSAHFAMSIALAGCGLSYLIYALFFAEDRNSEDVLGDLLQADTPDVSAKTIAKKRVDAELTAAGIKEVSAQRAFRMRQRLIIISAMTVAVLVFGLLLQKPLQAVLMGTMLAWAVSYIFTRRQIVNRQEAYKRSIDFSLPLVMERLVMAVSAGFDVLAAVQKIVELERNAAQDQQLDPVTELLERAYQLSVHGMPFPQALQQAGTQIQNPAVRHAFIYLARCYEEGGELMRPLRELSENTQLHYQERVEEEIARLPVKATLPLLCTFAGLIILFMTTPLIQVMELAKGASQSIGGP
jgi:type II secretory pathway component PulF